MPNLSTGWDAPNPNLSDQPQSGILTFELRRLTLFTGGDKGVSAFFYALGSPPILNQSIMERWMIAVLRLSYVRSEMMSDRSGQR